MRVASRSSGSLSDNFSRRVKAGPSAGGALGSPQNHLNFLFRSQYEPFRSQPANVVSTSLLNATDLQAIEAKSWWHRALVSPRPNVQLCGEKAPWPKSMFVSLTRDLANSDVPQERIN
jgi:hypothetical protein